LANEWRARSALRRERGERRPSVARASLPTCKLYCQTFPNFGLFSPRISKETFGGVVEFQGVTMEANRKVFLICRKIQSDFWLKIGGRLFSFSARSYSSKINVVTVCFVRGAKLRANVG
jgi:hypothetical protein